MSHHYIRLGTEDFRRNWPGTDAADIAEMEITTDTATVTINADFHDCLSHDALDSRLRGNDRTGVRSWSRNQDVLFGSFPFFSVNLRFAIDVGRISSIGPFRGMRAASPKWKSPPTPRP